MFYRTVPGWELKVYGKGWRIEVMANLLKLFGGGQGYITKIKHLIKILFITLMYTGLRCTLHTVK